MENETSGACHEPKEIVAGHFLPGDNSSEDTDIVNLTYDSGDIRENDVFVCIRGTRKDGHDYIREAVQKGAAAIVIEDMAAVRALEYGKMHAPTIIRVSGTRKALALMAANYYGHPERDLILVGVTGTKGKTTVSWMLKEILEKDGHKTGLMGTNGAYWGEERIPICHTTPPSKEVYELLDKMRKGAVGTWSWRFPPRLKDGSGSRLDI